MFSRFYFDRYVKGAVKLSDKYSSFKKNYGPPHFGYEPKYDAIENNEYLNSHNIDPEDTKFKGEHRVVPTAHGAH
jgi:hypothetical protein